MEKMKKMKKMSRWKAIAEKPSKTIPVMKVHNQSVVKKADKSKRKAYSVSELQFGKNKG